MFANSMANLNEFSYDGAAGEFVEIRVSAGDDVSNLELEVYGKTGSNAVLTSTVSVNTGTFTSDGTYDYYVISVALEDGPRAAIALVDNGTLIESVTWGSTNPVPVTGGALDGTSQPSIGDPLGNGSTGSLTPDGSGGWTSGTPTEGAANVCLTKGTRILTADGCKPIETIMVGDKVVGNGARLETVRWIGRRCFGKNALQSNHKLRPVRISAGALGNGLPKRDLLVSRQHRMLIKSKIAQRMFGSSEVLIPAIKLIELPGIFVDHSITTVQYYHLLFDKHEIIFAEGAPTESLFTGPEAMKAVPLAAREEIKTIFPEIAMLDYAPEPARNVPSGKLQKKLITRHLRNNKPLLESMQL